MTAVGILGLGVYLPPEVRTNDWWSPELVARWIERRARHPALPPPEHTGPGAARVLAALVEQARDPFQGAVERRILPRDVSVHDMEEHAARAALAHADVAPANIDLLLTSTIVPEFLLGNPACTLHHRLGLPARCLSLHTDIATYAFMAQLTLAEAMIASGRAHHALLVQSCAPSRLLDPDDEIAPFFGDAATAVVVGPVTAPGGIAASVHYTDGRTPRTLIASVPGGAWYDEGRARLHVGDPWQTREVFLQTADVCKASIDAALAKAGRTAAEVDFFAIHQGTPWLRTIVQDHAGLSRARSVETFRQTGYLFASTLPASLALAENQGLLAAGDVVVLVGGGPGTTYGATVMTWTR